MERGEEGKDTGGEKREQVRKARRGRDVTGEKMNLM